MTPPLWGHRSWPRTGNGVPGYAICQRIIIAMAPPTTRKKRPYHRNCFAMTLWSVEKTYFLRNEVGSGWMCCSAWKSGPT